MACLGVHFALTIPEVSKLISFGSDEERLDWLQVEIEETYLNDFPEFNAESGKAWDAMHRLLSDGDLSYYDGPEPLRFLVLGGEPLYSQDDYIMSLKTPEQVKEVASVLLGITKAEFKSRYDQMDAKKYGFPKSEDDFEYTWEGFKVVSKLFRLASVENRYVLFTADQ